MWVSDGEAGNNSQVSGLASVVASLRWLGGILGPANCEDMERKVGVGHGGHILPPPSPSLHCFSGLSSPDSE